MLAAKGRGERLISAIGDRGLVEAPFLCMLLAVWKACDSEPTKAPLTM